MLVDQPAVLQSQKQVGYSSHTLRDTAAPGLGCLEFWVAGGPAVSSPLVVPAGGRRVPLVAQVLGLDPVLALSLFWWPCEAT